MTKINMSSIFFILLFILGSREGFSNRADNLNFKCGEIQYMRLRSSSTYRASNFLNELYCMSQAELYSKFMDLNDYKIFDNYQINQDENVRKKNMYLPFYQSDTFEVMFVLGKDNRVIVQLFDQLNFNELKTHNSNEDLEIQIKSEHEKHLISYVLRAMRGLIASEVAFVYSEDNFVSESSEKFRLQQWILESSKESKDELEKRDAYLIHFMADFYKLAI